MSQKDWGDRARKIRQLSAEELLVATRSAGCRHNQQSLEIILLLCENARRREYGELGYKSLGSFAQKELGLSSTGSAYRYAAIAWLCHDVPGTFRALAKGELTLENALEAKSQIREMESAGSKKFNQEEKEEILGSIKNLNTYQTKKRLAEVLGKAPGEKRRRSKTQPLGGKWHEITVVLTDKELELFQKLSSILSHKIKSIDPNKIFLYMMNEMIERYDPAKKEERAQARRQKSSQLEKNRPDSIHINKRKMWSEHKRRCSFVSTKTGRQCDQTSYLDADHRRPSSKGGSDDVDNLQPMCSMHNRVVKRDRYHDMQAGYG